MSNLREWLREYNLEQYAAVFEANDIDLDILGDLDDHDLEKLGLSLGNRRRLLKAISTRGASRSATASAQTNSPSEEEPDSGHAERRQVTVLFADMVGSTALSAT